MELTIQVLAATDGLFWPGAGGVDGRAAVAERRAEFFGRGLLWRCSGSAAARKAQIREIDAMAAAGRMQVHRERGREAVFVRLPWSVDTEARARCCLATAVTSEPWLDLMAEAVAAGRGWHQGGRSWLRETELASTHYDAADAGHRLGYLAEQMLPLLVRGLAVSGTDCDGRRWYALTGRGLAAAAGCRGFDADWQPNEPDPGAREAYLRLTQAARAALVGVESANPQEIGPIPLPVGV